MFFVAVQAEFWMEENRKGLLLPIKSSNGKQERSITLMHAVECRSPFAIGRWEGTKATYTG
jgi:hypothetical protein